MTTTVDPDLWDAYEHNLLDAKDRIRLGKKDRTIDLDQVIDLLMSKEVIVSSPEVKEGGGDSSFGQRMKEQKEMFLAKSNLTTAQHNFAVRMLTYAGDLCAKRQDPTAIVVAWEKIKEWGIVPRENGVSTYLYAFGLREDLSDLTNQVATFHDLLFEPNEKTIALRVKHLIHQEDAPGAEALLQSLPSDEWRKLRTYTPLLNHYCESGRMNEALLMYRQMARSTGVHFDCEAYTKLVASLTENGYFCENADPLEGALEAGFSASHGPILFNEIAKEMADVILEINNQSARVLYNAFIRGFPCDMELLSEEEEVPIESTAANDDDLVACRVLVDSKTGVCPRTGATQRLFKLRRQNRRHFYDTLLDMASSIYKEYTQKLKQKFRGNFEDGGPSFAVDAITNFTTWLSKRDGEPFTAIVDGPNVGYFGHGTLHYSQVKLVVKKLEAMNETPLVVMPAKYTRLSFRSSRLKDQKLSERDQEVLNELIASRKMYVVPPKCLDDYYWMIASVTNQTNMPLDEEWLVDAGNEEGRYPGLRPILITNDQMRDHKLALLEPRLFRRWYSSHIVNFNFTEGYEDEWEERNVDFFAADFFSREIQGNPSGSNGALAWHFPVTDWDDKERLCLRIP